MAQPVAQKLTPAQIERKRVDDFYNARMAERRAAMMAQSRQQVSDPNSNPLMNLIRLLTGQSPLQQDIRSEQ